MGLSNRKCRIKISFSADNFLINFIGIYYLIGNANFLVKTLYGDSSLWSIFSKGILFVLLLLAVYAFYLYGNLFKFFFLEFVALLMFFITFCLGNITHQNYFVDAIFDTCVSCIPLAISFYSVKNVELWLKKLYSYSWLSFFILLFCSSAFFSETDVYSMSLGYSMLMPLLIIWDHYIEEKHKKDLLVIISSILLIVIKGSRGPIVCIVVFMILKFLFSKKIKKDKKILYIIFGSIIFPLIIIFYKQGLLFIDSMFRQNGIKSRTLTFLLNGDFISHDSGRNVIQMTSWENILKKPIFGWGLGGGWPDTYPHNIIIEFILYFGLPLGLLCCAFSLVVMYRGVKASNHNIRRLAHVFVALFVQFFASATFLWNYLFFACLAICLNKNNSIKLDDI